MTNENCKLNFERKKDREEYIIIDVNEIQKNNNYI